MLVVLATALVAVIGVAALWPRGPAPDLGAQPSTFVDATVRSLRTETCPAVEVNAPTQCRRYEVGITSGPNAGTTGEFIVRDIDFGVPDLEIGARVVLLDVATSPAPYRFTYADRQRSSSLWFLATFFVIVVVAFGRWQGIRALAGLAASALVIAAFIVPALLRDGPSLWIALCGTVVIAFLALYVAHGVNMATTVALAGTLVSLAIITVVAVIVAGTAQLTGFADDEGSVLRVTASALDLRGLLVAGIVIGALGVLDDVTVTQVSTVAALRRASPDASREYLYREAVRVGRDHVASTVNTLVLAYAGASLPLVLLFAQGSAPTGRVITSEIVAVELVRMLVGSIGLVMSVPITTMLAATILTAQDAEHAHGHGHAHGAEGHDRAELPARWEDFGPEE